METDLLKQVKFATISTQLMEMDAILLAKKKLMLFVLVKESTHVLFAGMGQ